MARFTDRIWCAVSNQKDKKKEKVVAKFLALNPIPELEEIQMDFPNDLNTNIKV